MGILDLERDRLVARIAFIEVCGIQACHFVVLLRFEGDGQFDAKNLVFRRCNQVIGEMSLATTTSNLLPRD